MRHQIMGLLEWECTVCLCPIIVSYPLLTQNEYEILRNEIKHMCNETIQPPETNGTMFQLGPSLLGAKFVRGRVCQGPSLSGAEMSWNRYWDVSEPG